MSDGEGDLAAMAAAYSARHPHSDLSISRSGSPPSLVATISGSLDSETSSEIAAFLRAAQDIASREQGLCVDLAGLTYVSSTGIGTLATAMMEYEKLRTPFLLRSVPVKIRDLFKLLGVWSFFKTVEGNAEGT